MRGERRREPGVADLQRHELDRPLGQAIDARLELTEDRRKDARGGGGERLVGARHRSLGVQVPTGLKLTFEPG